MVSGGVPQRWRPRSGAAGSACRTRRGSPAPIRTNSPVVSVERVGIAIALACRPALVIADEPTTALDVTVQAEIMRLLRELVEQDGTALVFISHDVALVSTVVEQVIVMRAGRIVERAAVDDVVAEPAHDYTRELLAAARLTHLEAAR